VWSLGAPRCASLILRPDAPLSCRLWGHRSLSWQKACRERDEVLPRHLVAMTDNKDWEGSEAKQGCPDGGLALRLSRGEAGLVQPGRQTEPVHPRLATLKPSRRSSAAASDAVPLEERRRCCLANQNLGDETLCALVIAN
jgi:hypothetical protein